MKNFFTLLILIFVCISQSQSQSLLPPNFLVVVLDDAEFNMLRPFVPEFVSQPGIDSIASAGATIRMDNVQSYCNPSRYSMLTGLYPHNHGATDNVTPVNPNFTLLTKVLSSHGYKVAIDGKFTNSTKVKAPSGIKKWWIILADNYTNGAFYNYKGKKWVMPDNSTQVINDTAKKWIATLQPPFFLWVGEMLPHRKPVPTDANKNLYKNKPIPLPADFYPFTTDYPSYVYTAGQKFYTYSDSTALRKSIQANYECLNDLSDFLLSAVNTLRTRGLLENTFIIIVGDNGFMNGEHLIYGKNKPYEEAMRVPCFIRYAPWFTPGTVVDYTGFQSIDFPATILDAAGINDVAFNNQSLGKSLRYLMTPGNERKVQYFEKIKRQLVTSDNEGDIDTISPSFRSVKTLAYKYIRYQCDSLTEELFNLSTDPQETTNLAKSPSYVSVINQYRNKLDSMAIVLNDTISGDTIVRDCKLVSSALKENQIKTHPAPEVFISPNPVNQSLRLQVASLVPQHDKVTIQIYNSIGQLMYDQSLPLSSVLDINISTTLLINGVYFLRMDYGSIKSMHPFVVEQ